MLQYYYFCFHAYCSVHGYYSVWHFVVMSCCVKKIKKYIPPSLIFHQAATGSTEIFLRLVRDLASDMCTGQGCLSPWVVVRGVCPPWVVGQGCQSPLSHGSGVSVPSSRGSGVSVPLESWVRGVCPPWVMGQGCLSPLSRGSGVNIFPWTIGAFLSLFSHQFHFKFSNPSQISLPFSSFFFFISFPGAFSLNLAMVSGSAVSPPTSSRTAGGNCPTP